MAISFNENDIEEFRDCFSLFAREKYVTNPDTLATIMRSLAFSPTSTEVQDYFMEFNRDGRIDFATFIQIMEKHSKVEKCQQDIIDAFKAHDKNGVGSVPGAELKHILTQFGNKMTPAEVDQLFKDAGVSTSGPVHYDRIIKVLLNPLPGY
jgi:calmodulin